MPIVRVTVDIEVPAEPTFLDRSVAPTAWAMLQIEDAIYEHGLTATVTI